jgi:hypothetical protein
MASNGKFNYNLPNAMTTTPYPLPFFSPDSFWNTPLPPRAAADHHSARWMQTLRAAQPSRPGLHINLNAWTIPVFHADAATPRHRLCPKLLRCHLSQGHVKASEPYLSATHPLGLHASVRGHAIPIPDRAAPDGEADAHLSIVDLGTRTAYDLWQCRRDRAGHWHTNAAIAYPLDGPGLFTVSGLHRDESVHFHGPCRASGVPALAGLIMREEIRAGRIAHKLAWACPVPGLQRYVSPPAAWTDGWLPGGVPEGCTLRLDPALDLARFDLRPAALTIARALQEYGAVLVDYAGAVTLYGELLTPHGQSWAGRLGEEDLAAIGLEHYHILATGALTEGGSHPVYHQGMARLFYDYIERHGTAGLERLEPWRGAYV